MNPSFLPDAPAGATLVPRPATWKAAVRTGSALWATRARAGRFTVQRGFTLIELMITVAIVAILSAIALPAYTEYILRGRLVDGRNALASLRARMEQYYQDNRTYQDVSTTIVSPCVASTVGTFAIACPTLTATTYVIRATGSGTTASFVSTMDNNGNQVTTGLPTAWGTVPTGGYACWVAKKGETC